MEEAELPACGAGGMEAGGSTAGAQEDEADLVGPLAPQTPPPAPPPGCPAAQDEGGPDATVSMESAEGQPMSLSGPGAGHAPSLCMAEAVPAWAATAPGSPACWLNDARMRLLCKRSERVAAGAPSMMQCSFCPLEGFCMHAQRAPGGSTKRRTRMRMCWRRSVMRSALRATAARRRPRTPCTRTGPPVRALHAHARTDLVSGSASCDSCGVTSLPVCQQACCMPRWSRETGEMEV